MNSKRIIFLTILAGIIAGIFLGWILVATNTHNDAKEKYARSNNNLITITPTPTSFPPTPIWSHAYPVHRDIYATMFWVGEKATDENDYIPNEASAWDTHWLDNFGGIDNPYTREGNYPKGFIPKQNPFYFALPYNDFSDSGRKENATRIPWYFTEITGDYSYLKNRWIRIKHNDQICYAQWEDVGPFEDNDIEYVFGSAKPKNERAGIDLSPALKGCLHMATNDYVDWQFVNEAEVPEGPWKEIITTSQVNWR